MARKVQILIYGRSVLIARSPHPNDMVLAELIHGIRQIYIRKTMEKVKLEVVEQRAVDVSETAQATAVSEAAEVREKMAKLMFGPDGEKYANAGMKRLLTSSIEMGYPIQGIRMFDLPRSIRRTNNHLTIAMAEAIEEQEKTGRPVPKDTLGLPVIPPAEPPTVRHSRKAQRILTKVQMEARAGRYGPVDAGQIIPITEMSPESEAVALARFPPPGLSQSETTQKGSPRSNDKGVAAGKDSGTSPVLGHRASFWKFERTHAHDYDQYIDPINSDDRANQTDEPQYKSVAELEAEESAARKGKGPIVVKGFNPPSPAESRAMLKVNELYI